MVQFDPRCERCSRLAGYLRDVRAEYPAYHARPVAPFGARQPWLLIVGLAPGMHGANRTGRPFTGDYAGILLYQTLHELGLATRAKAVSRRDGLALRGCRITNAVKCLPPANKPLPAEVRECNRYLREELRALRPGSVVLALGRVAHQAILMARDLRPGAFPFRHGARHRLPASLNLLDSYHCSRYNTQTRRLTPAMFRSVLRKAVSLQAS